MTTSVNQCFCFNGLSRKFIASVYCVANRASVEEVHFERGLYGAHNLPSQILVLLSSRKKCKLELLALTWILV